MKPPIHFLGSTLLCVAAACATAGGAQADDLKLKDGTKISGTIVGFEENSFKVKTNYGFALVQRDQVILISMPEAPKPPVDKAPAVAEAKAPSVEKPKIEPAPGPPPSAPPVAPVSKPAPTVAAAAPAPAPAVAKNAEPPVSPSPSPALPERPKPAPEPIREQVSGNTYTNETYHFRMFKPPDWDVIASAPAVLPGAITAMGTADDTTYLLIGQEPAGKSLAADMDATEHRLREVMGNFRALSEEHPTVSGQTAMEHHFRGSVDQHDWSGVVVLFARGAKLYTIFGMTRADNDLVQLQENVISRAISSLQFTE